MSEKSEADKTRELQKAYCEKTRTAEKVLLQQKQQKVDEAYRFVLNIINEQGIRSMGNRIYFYHSKAEDVKYLNKSVIRERVAARLRADGYESVSYSEGFYYPVIFLVWW
jgi:hypothetical protein